MERMDDMSKINNAKMKDRESILNFLRSQKQYLLDRFDLVSIALIGSMARGDYNKSSDVDIMVEFNDEIQSIRLTKIDLSDYLQDVFGRPVQIISRDFIKPQYRRSVFRDVINV